MVRISRTQRQNIVKLLIVASLIVGGYSIYSVIFGIFGTHYPISEEGKNTNQINADLTEIDYDYQKYLDSLFNSSYFDSLDPTEQMDFLENLLGESALDYLSDSGMSGEDLMAEYGDELGGVFGSLAGGESFDTSMLDDLPPELALALLARPMYYVYETNPSNPWNDRSDTLFKIAAYDFLNSSSYDWEVSDTLDNSQSLTLESSSVDEKWKIKYPIMASPQVSSGLPAVSPKARVMEYTPTSDPLYTSSVDLKNQLYLGGMQGEASYSETGEFTNLTYNLLYSNSDYQTPYYYQTYGVSMSQYTGGNLGVTECLKGPHGASDWTNYKNANPFFATAVSELEATTDFINANNVYDKTQAVVDYVGANFVYDPLGSSRPPTDADPIEWLSETRETAYPFEITSLTVALARLEGLSVRYVSGYKWNDFIAMEYNTVFTDSTEGDDTAYTYIMANMYTFIEVFIPTSTSSGDWVEFDNNFSATPSQPPQDELQYILTFNGSYTPNFSGYDRGIITELDIEVNASYAGNPLSALEVVMNDISYNTIIDSTYTNSSGIATFTLPLQNMVSGPHIFNFTSTYLGEQFGNVSIINIFNDVDIYLTSLTPSVVNVSVDETATLSLQGIVWDPDLSAPIKNAQILAQGVLEGGTYPTNAIDFFPSATTVTDINGVFSFDISMLGWDQGNYSIYTQFTGEFDISNDLQQSGPILINTHGFYADYDNDTVEYLHINPSNYDFTALLDSTEFSSTDSADNRIKNSGDSVNISISLLRDLSGEAGASVTLTDMTNGTVFNGVTLSDGSCSFIINYGAGVNPGPHRYHISLYYNDGVVILTGSNYEDFIWVIYNNTLTCQNSRTDWNDVLAVGDTLQTIEITGRLNDTNLLGHHYAELTYWILDDGGSVYDTTGIYFSVNFLWDTNSQDGDFTALISLTGSPDPILGNYSIIIGFDGTLVIPNLGVPELSYFAGDLATNATKLNFTVYDKPYLDTFCVSDTEGSGIIAGITHLSISGKLYYSNGTIIAGQDIILKFHNENGDPVYTHSPVSTNSTGDYEILDLLILWDVSYYTVSFNGDDTKYLDIATLESPPLVG